MLLQVRAELAMKAAGGRFLTKSEPRPLLLSLLASVVCDASLPAPSTSPWFIMCHPIEQPMEGQRMGWDHAFTQVLRVPFCHVPGAQSPAMPPSPNPSRPAGVDADLGATGVQNNFPRAGRTPSQANPFHLGRAKAPGGVLSGVAMEGVTPSHGSTCGG